MPVTVGLVVAMVVPAHAAAGRGHGLPSDAPHALYAAEPELPKATGWPGSNTAFSRTSGTGRYAGGGYFWTDWLYDDHGTTTASTGDVSVTAGTPSFGTYTYPPGPAHNNGADIFRAAVLLRPHASYWRVDWNTLADPRVPIAEWTFDRDNDPATGGSDWPGGAGVHSRGIDTAMLVSSGSAELLDVATGRVIARLHTTTDRRAQSFVVRLPSSILRPRGTWRIRLAAGLANPTGTGFAPAADALQSQTAVYNVTFRHRSQEPTADDYWDDSTQTSQLAIGDVSPFYTVLRWRQLARHRRTAQPRPSGWSDRWYVSAVDLGPGVLTAMATITDGRPNYLGRVQPYAVYVPRSYRPGHPAPLTFLLHSLFQNHNQYAATTPRLTSLACEARHSICVSPFGRGPDGHYFDSAELDFWQVWHAVAQSYSLDPNRTVLAGYSMGGMGSAQLAMEHPDLFARAITLAGAVGDAAQLRNLRWVPVYLSGGLSDELVPVSVQRAEAAALGALGDRFRWLVYFAVDHVAFELSDAFTDAARYMRGAHRAINPGRFSFTWTPHNEQAARANGLASGSGISTTQLPRYGVGTTGDYWVRRLQARHRNRAARVTAYSGMRPVRGIRTQTTRRTVIAGGPGPGIATELTWNRTTMPRKRRLIRLRLTNVRSLRLVLHAAGFPAGDRGLLRIITDGPVRVRLGTRTIRLHHAGRIGVPFSA